MQLPVLFREEPCAPRLHTAVGMPPVQRRPRRFDLFRQLAHGPFLAAFDAGIADIEDDSP